MSRMVSPFKDKKSGVYYFRMAVPKDLIPALNRREFKSSLRTKNLAEAKRAFPEHLANAQRTIEHARAKLTGATGAKLTARDCVVIAERWYKRVKDQMEATGDFNDILTKSSEWMEQEGAYRDHYMGLSDTMSISGGEWLRATEQDFINLASDLSNQIDEQLAIENLLVPHDSKSYVQLAKALHPYVHHLEALCKARMNNDWNYEPVATSIFQQPLSTAPAGSGECAKVIKQQPTPSGNSLSSVLDAYIVREQATLSNQGSRMKTLDETKSKVHSFIEIMSDMDVATVRRSHIVEFRDTLLQLPKGKNASLRNMKPSARILEAKAQGLTLLSPTTVKVYLRHLSTVFSYALERDLVTVNPVSKVAVKKAQNKSQTKEDRGYTEQELLTVFSDETFIKANADRPFGMSCYWVPLLCRYTGARVNEIAQLRVEDVLTSPEGIHFIYIREGVSQSVKSESSVREVPLSDHLIELGFMDYVQRCREWVFPELPVNKYGNKGLKIGEWWGKKVRGNGVNVAQPSHAFRHTFKTAMRSLGVADTVSDAITGHAANTEGSRYGVVTLETKKAAIDNLPKLDLDRL